MFVRTILSIILLGFAASACKNEPYETVPLGVITFLNHDAGIKNTYRYREQKIYSFLSMGTDTIVYMRFHYSGDDLSSIVTDSTRYSHKLTSFYPSGEGVIDSTFLNDTTGHHLYSTRTITYDGDSRPLTVYHKVVPDSVYSERRAELTWEDGNVVKLATYDLSTGEPTLVRDLTIEHDDQYCVYMKNSNYLFTLALDDLYWLSKNNPMIFYRGESKKEYTYWYNKLGYPSNFKNETGALYGVEYRQVR